jgi:hypothetical protein
MQAPAAFAVTTNLHDKHENDESGRQRAAGIMEGTTMTKMLWIASVASLFLVPQLAAAAGCLIFDAARNAAYVQYIRLVVDEVKSSIGKGDAAVNASVQELSSKYAGLANVGDVVAVRKLIGLGLFTTFAANREPLDVTFKLACESARKHLPPVNVLDPLTCAVIAVDRSRLNEPANQKLAKEMIEMARSNLESDKNGAGARNLFETTSQAVLSCLPQP